MVDPLQGALVRQTLAIDTHLTGSYDVRSECLVDVGRGRVLVGGAGRIIAGPRAPRACSKKKARAESRARTLLRARRSRVNASASPPRERSPSRRPPRTPRTRPSGRPSAPECSGLDPA